VLVAKLKDIVFNGNKFHASRMLMWMCSCVMFTFLLILDVK